MSLSGGVCLALALLLSGCGDPVFINNESVTQTDTPTLLEDFVIHRYEASTESLRVHGVQAVFQESDQTIYLDDVTVFMYSDSDGENCQFATLRSQGAVLYLEDDKKTTNPLYRSNDIDFSGQVTLLDRQGRRMRTEKMRFTDVDKTYQSDGLTTIALLNAEGVMVNVNDEGFSYDGSSFSTGPGRMRPLEGAPGESLCREIERQIAETPWSCGSDDTPLPTTPREATP